MATKKDLIAELETLTGKKVTKEMTVKELEKAIVDAKSTEDEDNDPLLEGDEEAEVSEESVEDEEDDEDEAEVEEMEQPKETPQKPKAVNASEAFVEGAMAIKRALEAQPKQMLYIPLQNKEKAGVAVQTVTINGYRYSIRKGEQVEVPKQIADIVIANMQASHQILKESGYRIGNDQQKMDALS